MKPVPDFTPFIKPFAALIIVLFLCFHHVKAGNLVMPNFVSTAPKDTTNKKDTIPKLHGFDISLAFLSRQTYYGSYDANKLSTLSPEVDYLFRNGIMLSLSTATLSGTHRLISEVGLGISWNYKIDDNWFGDIGYSRYRSTLSDSTVVLSRQIAVSNDLTASLENDNSILNTSLRFDVLASDGARDFVFDLQNYRDFDLWYKSDNQYISIGIRNDLFFGSVNSLNYITKRRILLRRRRVSMLAVTRTGGILYDNIAIPLTIQLKRFAIIPELDCSIGNEKFIKDETQPVTYLNNEPLFYFGLLLDYNLQKKTPRHHH